MPCIPRQIPNIGVSRPFSKITSSHIPKYFFCSGDPGPGDIIILSGLIWLISVIVNSSFLFTMTSLSS